MVRFSFFLIASHGSWWRIGLPAAPAALACVSRGMRIVHDCSHRVVMGIVIGVGAAAAGLSIAPIRRHSVAIFAAALAMLLGRLANIIVGGDPEAELIPDDDPEAFGATEEGCMDKGIPLRVGALDDVHRLHAEGESRPPQRPGLAKVRTERVRTIEGMALADVLDGRPWSRRRLAEALQVAESIVRRWCSGEKPIQSERLKDACPVIWHRWRARLAVAAGQGNAA